MASIESRNGRYRLVFRYGGQKFSRSLGTSSRKTADAIRYRVEENLRLIEQGVTEVPNHVDIATFLLSDGRLTQQRKLPEVRTLGKLFDDYFASISDSSLERSTVAGMEIHRRHLERIIGKRFNIAEMRFSVLQDYVASREREPGIRGRRLSPQTIKKEIVTLTVIWGWAKRMGYVHGTLPKARLRYPKANERPPFQTYSEIESELSRGELAVEEEAELWDSLFLRVDEIDDLLVAVKAEARHPFIYPMFVFAAHTGARRSELIRSRIEDVRLDLNIVKIREKKRVRGKFTTRRVPMSQTLQGVLSNWLDSHPGGRQTFCMSPDSPLTVDQAHHHFKKTVSGCKWKVMRGWHVLRHSYISGCAAAGVPQHIINTWAGHQTEAMARRYRHLYNDQEQAAIKKVFD